MLSILSLVRLWTVIHGRGVADDRARGNSFNLVSLARTEETEGAGELRLLVVWPVCG